VVAATIAAAVAASAGSQNAPTTGAHGRETTRLVLSSRVVRDQP
jgi:hypothetical protein